MHLNNEQSSGKIMNRRQAACLTVGLDLGAACLTVGLDWIGSNRSGLFDRLLIVREPIHCSIARFTYVHSRDWFLQMK